MSENLPRAESEAPADQSDYVAALAAAEADPKDPANWDVLEGAAEESQRPDEVAELYRKVLGQHLPAETAMQVGERAAHFHEEWYGEDSPHLVEVLHRMLEVRPDAAWPLERLTILLTVKERWNDLLNLYDRALDVARDDDRRAQLLEEAAGLAKDFAGETDRAIDYLLRLIDLRPRDAPTFSSLERLLSRAGRWEPLIALFRRRIEVVPPDNGVALRTRIAECYLDRLGDPASSLVEVRGLLEDGFDPGRGADLLERVVAHEASSAEVRKGALVQLRELLGEAGRGEDVIRVLDVALARAEGDERVSLLRELARRTAQKGEVEPALSHLAEVLRLDPRDEEAQEQLAQLAQDAGRPEVYVRALVAAAEAAGPGPRKHALLVEAADTESEALGHPDAATELYQQVLESEARPAVKRTVARKLERLLEEAERHEARLSVLAVLAELEDDPVEQRRVFGQSARLADRLGQPERALDFWSRRLELDAADLDALDALIELTERERQWSGHVDALFRRVQAPGPQVQKRLDLARVARAQAEHLGQLDAAIETWLDVQARFGEDAETVDALFDLQVQAGRYDEIFELLTRAAGRDAERAAEMLARMAEVARDHLGRTDEAAEGYRRALLIQPSLPRARDGLRALLDDPAARPMAVRGLARAFELTEDIPALLELLDARLELAFDDEARFSLLAEAARLEEESRSNAAGAFDAWRRAFALFPGHPEAQRALIRLGEHTERWSEVCDALGEAARALPKAERAAALFREQAQLYRTRLDDPDAALRGWLRALELEPSHEETAAEVVQLGGAHDLAAAARALVLHSAARGALSETLLAAFEAAGAERAAEAAQALLAAVPAPASEGGLDASGAADASPTLRDLDPKLGRALLTKVAALSAGEAEAALRRALDLDPGHRDTLLLLADVQRAQPGRPLVETLGRLAETDALDLDPLAEAAKTALEAVGDVALATSLLERLLNKARRLWERGQAARGRAPSEQAVYALFELVRLALADGNAQRAVDLLVDGARLPVEPARSREMRRRAGVLLRDELNDPDRALKLLAGVVAESAEDAGAVDELCRLLEARERYAEVLALRQRQLEGPLSEEDKLHVRLETARILGLIEARSGRVSVLRRNLAERPGHQGSVDALCSLLAEAGRDAELAELLTTQAMAVEQQGAVARARDLWTRAAQLLETSMRDVGGAVNAYRRAAAIEPEPTSLDALARLYLEQDEPAVSATWLQRRLDISSDADRPDVALRLAEAHLASGVLEQASAVLERVLAETPTAHAARSRLAHLYRANEQWEPLARLLAEGAQYSSDSEAQLQSVREAAALFADKLHEPVSAIPVLQLGVELAPEDAELKKRLSAGLSAAGRFDEARDLLEGLVATFGRRRSAERALVHYQLARVEHAAGDLDAALTQLDKARRMDMSHPEILRMSGQLALSAGQLERAEQAYRALLLGVRRQDPASADVKVGASEVLYELSLLAKADGDETQAKELLETALSTASQHDAEARRLKADLVGRGEFELALRAVDMRLSAVSDAPSEARMLAERADLLAEHFERAEEALTALLRAVELDPADDVLHKKCRALAKGQPAMQRYIELLDTLVGQARRKEDRDFAAELLLRRGEATEVDLGDLDQAAEVYAKVEGLGVRLVDAWLSLARVADARGDSEEEVRVLRKLVEAGDDAVPDKARHRALYRIAEVELAKGELEAGLDTVERALEGEPRYARAGAILEVSVSQHPDHERLLNLYESVARRSGDPAMILDFLERRVSRPGATLDQIREGVERADVIGAPERAESLLRIGLVMAGSSPDELRDALWIPVGLAERREAAGDIPGAMEQMRAATAAVDEHEAEGLLLRYAAMARKPGGDLKVAAETYGRLLLKDPTNRELWEPLTQVYAELRDRPALEDVVERTLDAMVDHEKRNALRMVHATYLLDSEGDQPAAVEVLKQVLDEDPDHLEATERLADIFQASGDTQELIDLLYRKLDRARDQRDIPAICALTQRMGRLAEEGADREGARDFYRTGLDWAPESPELLEALLNLLDEDEDPVERADLMERLLAVREGAVAVALAEELAAFWQGRGDIASAIRVLNRGFRACPSHAGLRDQLEAAYRESGRFDELAEAILFDAQQREDVDEALVRYREASAIYREQLSHPEKAAEALRHAFERRSADLSLLEELVQVLSDGGLHGMAVSDVAAALSAHPDETPARARLLRQRAKLEVELGTYPEAVRDLEDAYRIDPDKSASALTEGLERHRLALREAGDLEQEGALTHRQAGLLLELGEREASRDLLAQWSDRAPEDREALRRLRDFDLAEGRFVDVIHHQRRLIDVETGQLRIQAGLGLLEAARRVGKPEAARSGLEEILAAHPDEEGIRQALAEVYQESGAHGPLAEMLAEDAARATDNEARYGLLRRVGELYLTQLEDPERATGPLKAALELDDSDYDLVIHLADAYIGTRRFEDAIELLQTAIGGFKRRRSPQLAAMQARMARIAAESGDPETQKEWLSVALDADKNSGEIATELAELALRMNDDDTALKALRVVTMLRTPGPMSKAVAFLRQAQISHRNGDPQKALLWARRARLEDETLEEAHTFLDTLGEG